ncbi:MAG: serine/threonine-protein kinase [Minicystis sp.]
MKRSIQGLPSPGDVLAGRFRVEQLLGAGGMGSVFAALDLRTGARVAIKLMLPEHVSSAELSGRFLREARAAASLSSRHVARVYEVGQLPDGALFMVMEMLEGRDLARTLSARGPLPIVEAVVYILETCDAIAEAHALGIVHRDLKPSNLFLTANQGPRPFVKVLDFGISKSTRFAASEGEALTATDSALGSPQYMSPEQLRSAKRVDHRTDIWSLGIILHKLVTGVLAFEADSVGAHLAMIVADPPTPLRRRRPDAPAELEQVVLRCLQKDLSLRFQNVGQLAVALAPFAPPEMRPTIDRIVGIVGREASYARLPAYAAPRPEMASYPTGDNAVHAAGMPSATPPPAVRAPQRAANGARFVPVIMVIAIAALTVVAAMVIFRPGTSSTTAASSSSSAATAALPIKPSAVPTASAAAPSEVRIAIEVEPAEAILELDGAPVSGRAIVLPRGETRHRLVARAPGYADEVREVSAREDTAVAIVLHRADAGAPLGPARKKLKGPVETSL